MQKILLLLLSITTSSSLEAYDTKAYKKIIRFCNKRVLGKEVDQLTVKYKDLRKANFRECDLSGLKFLCCNFEGADLIRTSFVDASLIGCVFVNALFYETNFMNADLRFADFRVSGEHRKSRFNLTWWKNANLCGSDLRGANFLGTNISGIQFDQLTKMAGALFAQYTAEDYNTVPEGIRSRGEVVLTRQDFIHCVRHKSYVDIWD